MKHWYISIDQNDFKSSHVTQRYSTEGSSIFLWLLTPVVVLRSVVELHIITITIVIIGGCVVSYDVFGG